MMQCVCATVCMFACVCVCVRAGERERERERLRDRERYLSLGSAFHRFLGFPPSVVVLFTLLPEGLLLLVQHFSWLLRGILTQQLNLD